MAERIAGKRGSSLRESVLCENWDVAQCRLGEWRSQTPFENGEWLSRRLRLDNLDDSQFLALLGESEEGLRKCCGEPPDWVLHLAEAFSGADVSRETQPTFRHGAFTPLIEPLILRALTQICDAAKALSRADKLTPIQPEKISTLLFSGLIERLDWIMSRTVVLEMHCSRISGALRGETPRERFRNFIADLRQPERVLAFFREYPVLARQLVESLDLWVESNVEFLSRLQSDWHLLGPMFSPESEPGLLESVSEGMGDLHRRARSVRVLTFTSGLRLVYKPRPMEIDVRFGELLAWLNQRGAPDLKAAKVLDRGEYGWSEYIAALPCQNQQELERFYLRQGALLAILHALSANDFHRENLVANGENPVLIDLESLCAADYGRFDPEMFDSLAHFELNSSVMNVMLLPFFHEGKEGEIADLSGLGGDAGQLSAHMVPCWEEKETDQMHLTWKRLAIPPANHRPTLQDESVDPLSFSAQIEEGFAATYRLLLGCRNELLGKDSPLSSLGSAHVRVIFRASQFYGFILEASYHPDLLRDALDRDRHFDRLWFGMERSKLTELSMRLISSEREDLWRGDIPYFSTEVNSLDVVASDGRCLRGVFRRSGLDVVRSRLQQLSDRDLETQLWYVRSSLTALAMDAEHGLPRYVLRREPNGAGRERLLALAVAAGERLGELAKRGEKDASWLGLVETVSRGWWLRPLDTDLYSGLPGVALFLAYLGKTLGRDDFTQLAEGTLVTLRRQLQLHKRVGLVGGFAGWCGLLYTWTHLAVLWQREELLNEALSMLPHLSTLVDNDIALDVVRGSAGGIVPLLGLFRATGSELALDLAQRMGDRLVATACPSGRGKAWVTDASPVRPLTGFSHGASGPAWGLIELYGNTGEERYRETALAALTYETDLFSPEAENWPDLRIGPTVKEDDPPRFMAAWCHGACGIGLSRLRMFRHLAQPSLLKDAEIAVGTTLRKGFGHNHSLCHGDLGCLDLLLEANRVLGGWREELDKITARVLASIDEHGFLCGVPLFVETPGLMDGLAGIGYGLLRLAEPDHIPCVLMLDPPISLQSSTQLHLSES